MLFLSFFFFLKSPCGSGPSSKPAGWTTSPGVFGPLSRAFSARSGSWHSAPRHSPACPAKQPLGCFIRLLRPKREGARRIQTTPISQISSFFAFGARSQVPQHQPYYSFLNNPKSIQRSGKHCIPLGFRDSSRWRVQVQVFRVWGLGIQGLGFRV